MKNFKLKTEEILFISLFTFTVNKLLYWINNMNNGRLIMLRQQLGKLSANAIAVMKAERLLQRFNKGTHNAVRLRKALAVTGHHHLTETTLLTHDVHKQHAALLSGRYLKQWDKVVKNSISVDVAKEQFRFLTLLDCIELPDPTIALKLITKRYDIKEQELKEILLLADYLQIDYTEV